MTQLRPIWAVVAAIFIAIYARDTGQGFISDDYAWIAHGRFDRAAPAAVFTTSVGFYRPLTSLSFGLNYALAGMNPKSYGLTNLALALVVGALVGALAAQLGCSAGAATIAAALWLFNFHGVNMSVLWLSGRTSLLVTGFAVASALSLAAARPAAAAVLAFAAMLSKEEAAVLPALFTVWYAVERARMGHGRQIRGTGVLTAWAALALYLALRLHSGAFWPQSAPSFYQATLDLSHIARNVAEYADRSLTFSLLALAGATAVCRRWPSAEGVPFRVALVGGLWFVFGFCLTVFLPVRSSLYVLFPGVGSSILMAACIAATTNRLTESQAATLRRVALAALILLLPVYWSRNVRWTELAVLSNSVIGQLRERTRGLPEGSQLAIIDDATTRANLANAWANLSREMSLLEFGGHLSIRVYGSEERLPSPAPTLVFQLRNGRLVDR